MLEINDPPKGEIGLIVIALGESKSSPVTQKSRIASSTRVSDVFVGELN